jgi:outer membrane autotransporter protein
LWLALCSSIAGPALAQSLSNLPGQSGFESRVGDAVSETCAGLKARGVNPAGSNPVEDLFGRCRELVQTGNDLTGAPETGFSLGLDAEETNAALLRVAHDEYAFTGTEAINIVSATFGVLETRLLALREGTTGIQIAGLPALDREGRPLASALSEHSAAGPDLDERVGLFLNGVGSWGDFSGTTDEAPFRFAEYGMVVGGDFRFTENLVAGAAFAYSNTDAVFRADASGGKLDRDAYTGALFSTWNSGPFYVEGIAGYTSIDYDLRRKIRYADVNRTAKGTPDADEWSVALGTGYDFQRGAFSFGPYLRAEYIDVDMNGFTESGANGLNLTYEANRLQSFTTDLGVQVSYAISTGFGIVTPYLRAEWEHEYLNDSRKIKARYSADPNRNTFFARTSDPDRDYANLGAGVSAQFPNGFSAFLDFDTAQGLSRIDRYRATLGGRLTF